MIDLHPAVASAYLFCPGNRPDRFEKALGSGVPVVLDLEDAVPPADKDIARTAVMDRLSQAAAEPPGSPKLAVRINDVYSRWGLGDLYSLTESPSICTRLAIVVPKVGNAQELRWLGAHLHRHHADWTIIALIETLEGLRNAHAIASSPGVAALGFGAADLASQMGIENTWPSLLFARSQVLIAAAEAGVPVLDVPTLDVHDEDALRAECADARRLGFHGKFAIHPRQIPTILEAFRPPLRDVERATAVCAAFEAAGGRACQLDGQMIDLPVYRAARNLLAKFSAL